MRTLVTIILWWLFVSFMFGLYFGLMRWYFTRPRSD